MELRLKEAAKLRFKRAIVAKGQKFPDLDIEILPAAGKSEAVLIDRSRVRYANAPYAADGEMIVFKI
jgi:hypothetical protein